MNGLILVGAAIILLILAYLIYGRWLAKTWGIDPNAKTPAYKFEDGIDFSPSSRLSVFSHQFNSIAAVGPITGPIIAAMFGWLPAFIWLIVGGIFFGAVQDFTSLYASVKNDGKSMGLIIEKYIGKTGKTLFLIFCWLFTLLVIAAFADILASTFSMVNADGSENPNGTVAASITMLYAAVAVLFGIFLRVVKPGEKVKFIIAIILVPVMVYAGFKFPLSYNREIWRYVIFGYCFVASVMPIWLLKGPRDYFSVFLFIIMIAGGALGIIIANPEIQMPAVVSFNVNNQPMFPILFVTIACGAISGFHSLVSSGMSSKLVSNERDILPVGYGAMLTEVLLAVIALVVACAGASNGVLPKGNPFKIFGESVAKFFGVFGVPVEISACIMVMCVADLAMTTIDSVTRIGRMSLQELLTPADKSKQGIISKIITNDFVATILTLGLAYCLCLAGYSSIWPLFGSANQLLAALVLTALAVFLKATNRKNWMLYVPMIFMFIVTMTALALKVIAIYGNYTAGKFVPMVDGLQLVMAVALMLLAVLVVFKSWGELLKAKPAKN